MPETNRINRWTARFESAELEHQYRQMHLDDDRKKIYISLVLVVASCSTFIYSDLQVAHSGNWLSFLLLMRLLVLGCAGVCYLVCRYSVNEDLIDHTILSMMLLACLAVVGINYSRPPDYYLYLLLDLIDIFVIYLYVPNRLLYQAAPVLMLTVCEAVLFLAIKQMPGPVSLLAIIGSFLTAHVIGFIAGRNHHLTNRRMFCTWRAEKELRVKYEEALSKIKTLSGLLPICASCKKIRDDKGYWNHIEMYISEHSQAEFTHGLCPDCIKKLYPDYSSSTDSSHA